VFLDGKAFALRAAFECRARQSEPFVRAGYDVAVTRPTRCKKSLEKMRRGSSALDARANREGILERVLRGITDHRRGNGARRKLRADLQADHERDRNRQNPEDDVRKGNGAALHDVVDDKVRSQVSTTTRICKG
jgi:hypothetical protein